MVTVCSHCIFTGEPEVVQVSIVKLNACFGFLTASTADDIRLVGGTSSAMGRLEVLVDGQWGTVCDAQFTFLKTEADVACRQLGFGQAADYGTFTSHT